MRVQAFDKIYSGYRTQLQLIYVDYAQLHSKMVYLFNYDIYYAFLFDNTMQVVFPRNPYKVHRGLTVIDSNF